MIGVRLIWQFTVVYLIRAIDRREAQRARRAGWRQRLIGGWAGMRGAVSLAAALALPLKTDAGAPFPERNLIIFLTFAVLFATLVGQGLTLGPLIRWLGVEDDGAEEREEVAARVRMAEAAIARVEELTARTGCATDTLERVRAPVRLPPPALRRDRGRRRRPSTRSAAAPTSGSCTSCSTRSARS